MMKIRVQYGYLTFLKQIFSVERAHECRANRATQQIFRIIVGYCAI